MNAAVRFSGTFARDREDAALRNETARGVGGSQPVRHGGREEGLQVAAGR